MQERFSRTELLFGKEALKKLQNAKVAVFGIGGVGGYAAEALVRTGIGNIDVFDGDVVSESNLNRQIVATVSAIGKPKTEVFKTRALDINPDLNINCFQVFYTKENAEHFNLKQYDYIIDAIDMVSAKVELIKRAAECSVPIISCMGAGNKLDPAKFEVADIYETSICPLARVMRRELKNAGVKSLKVVYSKEPAVNNVKSVAVCDDNNETEECKVIDAVSTCDNKALTANRDVSYSEMSDEKIDINKKFERPPVGSLMTVVATAGLLLANEVILYIVNRDGRKY